MDDHGRASFVNRCPGLDLVAAGGCYLFAPIVPIAKLRNA